MLLLLAIALAADPTWTVTLSATVAAPQAVVTYDSNGDGIRDSWREGCYYSIDPDTDILTAVCPPNATDLQ